MTNEREEYISLPLGKTLLRWSRPQLSTDEASSTVILMIHGATVPSWQFESIIPDLLGEHNKEEDSTMATQKEKYSVLRLDLYGHGKSARPDVRYNLDLFVNQVQQVIEQCIPRDTKVIALGHSMGSAILAKVASLNPQQFSKMILVAPMLDYKSLQPQSRLLSVPFIGEGLMRNAVMPKLKQRRIDRYTAIGRQDLGQRFIQEVETQHHGENELMFSDVLLRMFRDGAVGDQSECYQELGKVLAQSLGTNDEESRLKVHVIWGGNDTVVNEGQIVKILCMLSQISSCCYLTELETDRARVRDLENRGVSYGRKEGMEHNLLLAHSKECAWDINQFLKS